MNSDHDNVKTKFFWRRRLLKILHWPSHWIAWRQSNRAFPLTEHKRGGPFWEENYNIVNSVHSRLQALSDPKKKKRGSWSSIENDTLMAIEKPSLCHSKEWKVEVTVRLRRWCFWRNREEKRRETAHLRKVGRESRGKVWATRRNRERSLITQILLDLTGYLTDWLREEKKNVTVEYSSQRALNISFFNVLPLAHPLTWQR